MATLHIRTLKFKFHGIFCVTKQLPSFDIFQPFKIVKTILKLTGCTTSGGRWELGLGPRSTSLCSCPSPGLYPLDLEDHLPREGLRDTLTPFSLCPLGFLFVSHYYQFPSFYFVPLLQIIIYQRLLSRHSKQGRSHTSHSTPD